MKRVFHLGTLAQDITTGLISIDCSSGIDNYTTLQNPVGTFYQVSSDRTFYATALTVAGTTAGAYIEIGYGDDTVNNSATPPTNHVQLTKAYFCAVVKTQYCFNCFIN